MNRLAKISLLFLGMSLIFGCEKYNFSEDWSTRNIPVCEKVLGPLRGKTNIHCPKIGVFEGRSAIWILENILTHDTAKLTCIDIFDGNLEEGFYTNLRISGAASKVTTIKGRSQIELRSVLPNSFDIIYTDGSNTANDVLADAVLS